MAKEIVKYGFKEGLPQEFEVLDIKATFSRHKAMLTRSHRTAFYHIIWFQHGSPTHFVDFKPIEIKPNTLLFLNKDTIQQFDGENDFGGKVILFTTEFFCRTEADTRYLQSCFLFNDLFSLTTIRLKKQEKLFASILAQMNEELSHPKDHAQGGILHNLLHNWLLLAEREVGKQFKQSSTKGKDLEQVLLFKTLLEAHYKSHKQVAYYALKMALTPKRLNLITSGMLGNSPKEMIDARVLLEAKRVLTYSNLSIKEIGYDLGFEEPTNFIKYFKKHEKITPADFRAKHRMA